MALTIVIHITSQILQITYLAKSFLPFKSQLQCDFHLENCPESPRKIWAGLVLWALFLYSSITTLAYYISWIQSIPSITHSARHMGVTQKIVVEK